MKANKDKMVMVRMTQKMHDKLKLYADKHNMALAEAMRELCKKNLPAR